jgi:hypothetical protein
MPTSRRQFAKSLAAAGAAVPLVAADLLAQTDPKPLSKALTEVVKSQYALADDESERVAATLQELATAVDRLRQFPLVNSDEPDFTFSALTKRW